jgi:hypothetical protein
MTKANETPSKATEANTSNASKAAPSLTLQKGMRRLRSPHYHLEVGNELLGKVVAKHKDVASKKFKNKQDMVDVILAKPCKVRTGTDKKSKEPIVVTGETGTPCRFQVRAGMGQLFDMVSVGDVVNMVVTGKVGTDKGNDAWTFDVAVGNNSGDDGDEDDLNY